jgi:hypothetical protein
MELCQQHGDFDRAFETVGLDRRAGVAVDTVIDKQVAAVTLITI